MGKTLIIYYSRTGNTKKIAIALKNKINADIIEIKDKQNRLGLIGALGGIRDAHAGKLTEIEPETADLRFYELIYIVTPLWRNYPAPAIITAINNNDLAGKKVSLIINSIFTGFKSTAGILRKKLVEKNAEVVRCEHLKTLVIRKNKIIRWIEDKY